VRVVLGEPQHCGGDAHLPEVAVVFAEAGQGLLGAPGVAEAHQDVHKPGPDLPGERVRHCHPPGQPLGGPECGQRVGGPAASELEHSPEVLHPQRRRGSASALTVRSARCTQASASSSRPCQASTPPSAM
jgi:hypothetical protein